MSGRRCRWWWYGVSPMIRRHAFAISRARRGTSHYECLPPSGARPAAADPGAVGREKFGASRRRNAAMDENMVVCSACGGVNRLAQGRSPAAAKCGKCGRKLFSAHPADVDGATFHRHRTRSTLPVLVDVWAPWCEPCRRMAPAYEAAARELNPMSPSSSSIPRRSQQPQRNRHPQHTYDDPVPERQGMARQSGAMSSGQIVRWVRDRLRSAAA